MVLPWELLLAWGGGDMLGWLLPLKMAHGSYLLVHLLFHFSTCFVAQHKRGKREQERHKQDPQDNGGACVGECAWQARSLVVWVLSTGCFLRAHGSDSDIPQAVPV